MQGMDSYTPPIAISYISYCQVAFSVSSYYYHWLYYSFRSFHGENARNVNLCWFDWLRRNFICQKLSWLRKISKRSIITFQPPMLFLISKMYTIIIIYYYNSKIFSFVGWFVCAIISKYCIPTCIDKIDVDYYLFVDHWTLNIAT